MKNPFGTCVLMAPRHDPHDSQRGDAPTEAQQERERREHSVVMASAARGAGKPKVFVIHVSCLSKP